MGASINRFNGGLDQDTNIQDYSNQKYVDALNMRIISKGDFQLGSIENEKGTVASWHATNTILTSGDLVVGTRYKILLYVTGDDFVSGGIGGSNTTGAEFVATGTNPTWTNSSQLIAIQHIIKVYTYTVTTGNWDGTLTVSGEVGAYNVVTTDTALWVASIGATNVTPADENAPPVNPNYSKIKTANWEAYQYLNHVTIVALKNQTVTLTKSFGSATIAATSTPSMSIESDQRIIGYTTLRDRVIAFTTATANNSTPSNTISCIWSIDFNEDGSCTSSKLIYAGILDFSTLYPITAKSFYINDRYGKVYFVDDYNNLRHFNVYDPVLFCREPNQFDLISDVVFSKPKIQKVLIGGNYKSGVVQYAYQMYNKYGTESIMSPVSTYIPLTSYVDSASTSSVFLGNPTEENTGKSVHLKIDTLDTRFEYLKLYAIYYSSDVSTPEIRLIADQKILFKNTSAFDFVDDGFTSLGNITLQEFRNYYKNIFGAKSIEIQNNRLVAANLKESYFDISYDARAYNHAYNSTTFMADTTNTVFADISPYADCINTNYSTYKYQRQSTTELGGTGTNISYKFSYVPMELFPDHLSNGAAKGFQGWADLLAIKKALDATIITRNHVNNNSYTNYASPINSGQLVGYKRGEIYRFGIIFRDSKGRISPVKWIADIKFPEITDSVGDAYTGYSATTSQKLDNASDKIPVGKYVESEYGVDDCYYYIDFSAGGSGSIATYTFTATINSVTTTRTIATTSGYYNVVYFMRDLTSKIREAFGNLFYVNYSIDTNGLVINFLVNDKTNRTFTDVKITSTDTSVPAVTGEYTFYVTAGAGGSTLGSSLTNTYMYNKYYSATDTRATAKVLFPIFYVNTIPIDEFGNRCSYQIVRAVRTEKDKTRIAQGLLIGVEQDSSNFYPLYSEALTLWDAGVQLGDRTSINSKTVLNLISPEVNFRKVSVFNTDNLAIIASIPKESRTHLNNLFRVFNIKPMTQYDITIVDSGIVKADSDLENPSLQRVKDYNIYNVVRGGSTKKNMGIAGSSMFIAAYVNAGINITGGAATDMYIAEIQRTLTDQYGGNKYYDKINTEYIDCGHFGTGVDYETINPVFGGDTYIGYFDYQRVMWRNNTTSLPNAQTYETLLFPVETSVNMDWRYDKSFTKLSVFDNYNAQYIQESAGDYSGLVGSVDPQNPSNYFQEYDLYLENLAYSRPNNINKYLAQPLEVDGEETDCMIRSSDQFTYSSFTDDLLKFNPIDFKIIDTRYGKINCLLGYKENILFFQDKAIGIQPIAERTVIQDTQGIGLVLGTGDIFGKHQYISTVSGTRHKYSVLQTDFGIYYFDSQTKSLNKIGQGIQEVSTVKGLSSYFNTNVADSILSLDTPLNSYGIITGYDRGNKRILFTYLNNATNWTVSYNELTDSFESFHTYTPKFYLTDDNGTLHSEDRSFLGTYHAHGKGNYGRYYNNAYVDSTITYLNTDKPTQNKKYTNVELDYRIGATSLQSPTDTYRNDMITKIKFWNDYQTTNDLAVIGYNARLTSGSLTVGSKYRILNWNSDDVFTNIGAASNADNVEFTVTGTGIPTHWLHGSMLSPIPTSGTNIQTRQKFGLWRFAIPIAETNSPTDDSATRNTRFFDKHLFTKLTYTNTSLNKRFVLNNAITYYQDIPL